MRGTGLPQNLIDEVEKLYKEFDLIYTQICPDDDGDYTTLYKNYIKANGSKELNKALKH